MISPMIPISCYIETNKQMDVLNKKEFLGENNHEAYKGREMLYC